MNGDKPRMNVEGYMRALANQAAERLGEDADPFEVFDHVVEGMVEVFDNLPEHWWVLTANVMRKLADANGLEVT